MLKRVLVPVVATAMLVGAGPTSARAAQPDAEELQVREGRSSIALTSLRYDSRRGVFLIGVEVGFRDLNNRLAPYIVAQLSYQTAEAPDDAGVSPFAAALIRDLNWTLTRSNRYSTVLILAAPAPNDIDDVVGTVSANPTPHP